MQVFEKIKFLRKISIIKTLYFSAKYKSKIIVGKGCIINAHKNGKIIVKKGGVLFLGVGVSLPAKTVLDIYSEGILTIDGEVRINRGCKIVVMNNAKLIIGNQTFINENSRVYCNHFIEIGSNCAISWNVDIIDTDVHKLFENNLIINLDEKVIIGNNVWIGLKSSILKGAIINDNTVIGAASLVNSKCESNSVYAGVPCNLVRKNISWVK